MKIGMTETTGRKDKIVVKWAQEDVERLQNLLNNNNNNNNIYSLI